jgi:hypothetical protein
MKKLTENSCLLLLGWLFMAAVICPVMLAFKVAELDSLFCL